MTRFLTRSTASVVVSIVALSFLDSLWDLLAAVVGAMALADLAIQSSNKFWEEEMFNAIKRTSERWFELGQQDMKQKATLAATEIIQRFQEEE